MDKINWTWLHKEIGGGSSDSQDLIQMALPFGMSLAFAIAHRLVATGNKKVLDRSENKHDAKSVATELDGAANNSGITTTDTPSTPSVSPVDASNPNATLSQQQLVLVLAEKVRLLEEQLVTERVAHTTQVSCLCTCNMSHVFAQPSAS